MSKIDICIPCYQYGHFLRECLDSVLSQTIRDVRILVVDDGSTDDTLTVAKQYTERYACIDVVAHPTNLGHIRTYNEGIAWARSDYLLLLSADDMLASGALERAVTIMDERPEIVFTHGSAVDLYPDRPVPQPGSSAADWQIESGGDFIARMCRDAVNFVATPSVIVRTKAQKTVGGYRPALPHSGDMEMWLRLATQGAVACTPAIQAIKRVHGGNMSLASSQRVLRDYAQRADAFRLFFEHEGRDLKEAEILSRTACRRLAERAFRTAVAQSARGQWSTARSLFRLVCELDSSRLPQSLLARLGAGGMSAKSSVL